MNLFFVNTVPLWEGGEVWTLDAARAYAAREHEVTVVAAEGGALLERARGDGRAAVGLPRPGSFRSGSCGGGPCAIWISCWPIRRRPVPRCSEVFPGCLEIGS